ncbi:MAG: hypothetical protein R3F62_14005 [Planctomycetota bacterium]
MAKGSGNVAYAVGLIFAILISLALVFVVYRTNEELAKKEDQLKKALNDRREAESTIAALTVEAEDVRELFFGPGRRDAPIDKAYVQQVVFTPTAETVKEIMASEWIGDEDISSISDPDVEKAWKDLKALTDGGQVTFKDLKTVIEVQQAQLRAVVALLPRLRMDRTEQQGNAAKTAERLKEEIDKAKNDQNALSDELNRVKDDLVTKDRELDQVRRDYDGKLEEEQRTIQRMTRDNKIKEKRMAIKLQEKETRIAELTRKKRKTNADTWKRDGEVVFSDTDLGYAWVNLGRRHGLRRNTRFFVYQLESGGRLKVKGVVEVRAIEEDMSQCAILEDQSVTNPVTGERVNVPDRNDPIVRGDLVFTPTFDPQAQLLFTFLGERSSPTSPYDKAELQQKLIEIGAKIENQISTKTDYVILLGADDEARGQEVEAEAERAAQYGVTFMTEKELLEFLGR